MLYVVIGPPAAGKTTWVRDNAQIGDITIDYDALAMTLSPHGEDTHEHSAEVNKVTKAARQAAIDAALTVSTMADVYIIQGMPSEQMLEMYRRRGAEIVTIDPGRDVVMARAKTQRPWFMQGAIKRWYEERGDTVSSNPNRGGYRWRQLAAQFKKACAGRNDACHICEQPIDYSAPPQTASAFEADHFKPVETHPHLAYMVTNLRPSHSSCNRSRGSKVAPTGEWVAADF